MAKYFSLPLDDTNQGSTSNVTIGTSSVGGNDFVEIVIDNDAALEQTEVMSRVRKALQTIERTLTAEAMPAS
ncbi:MAG: hypothetical protein KDI56_12215 [Xanthomonadales bacterium]|nr:hypothetical protein [Xanthomonadales bacterium]